MTCKICGKAMRMSGENNYYCDTCGKKEMELNFYELMTKYPSDHADYDLPFYYKEQKADNKGIILGILALILIFALPPLSFIVAGVGIHKSTKNPNHYPNFKINKIGLILCIMCYVLPAIAIVMVAHFIRTSY